MKTKKLILLFFLFCSSSAFAYDSGIAIQSDQGATMHVYVNGKLYNKHPGKFVRVRSFHGLFHLQVRVLNPYTKQWTTLKKDIRVEKGFEFQFKVVFQDRRPALREIRKYPVYSRYFLNPVLYNRHPIS
jgi:hypothetical protein